MLLRIASTWMYVGYFLRFGTGSYPCEPHGLHFAKRFKPNQAPRNAPHSSIASIVYCEQVGTCLQFCPSNGEMSNWYALTGKINRNLRMP